MEDVTTYYLEMRSPDKLRAKTDSQGLEISECTVDQFEHSKSLYALVGGKWQWTGKQAWSDDDWKAYAENVNLRTFIASLEGATAGYFELQSQAEGDAEGDTEGDVEIAYFGLTPAFIGRGLGGYLLSEAIRAAWDWGASRVWVHTCTLDHPSALENYKARGMRLYRTERGDQT